MRGRCQRRHRLCAAATLSTRLNTTPGLNTVSAGLSDDTCASQHLERQRGPNERRRFSRVFSRSPFLPQSVDPGSSVKDWEVAGYPQFAALALPDSR